MTKIYLAHPISTKGEFLDSIRVADKIRKLENIEIYAAAENHAINNKENHPSPADLYHGDIGEIIKADILIVNITGGHQDGSIFELGFVTGFNEAIEINNIPRKKIEIIAYTSNARLLTPQFYKGIPSGGANHLVLGGVDIHGYFAKTEDEMIEKVKKLI